MKQSSLYHTITRILFIERKTLIVNGSVEIFANATLSAVFRLDVISFVGTFDRVKNETKSMRFHVGMIRQNDPWQQHRGVVK